QFGTHSLLGALATASVTALVVHSFGGSAVARFESGAEKVPAERFGTLFAAAAAGALSHIALDLISGARIAILWPFVDRRVSLPLVAMADPWIVGICLAWFLML